MKSSFSPLTSFSSAKGTRVLRFSRNTISFCRTEMASTVSA